MEHVPSSPSSHCQVDYYNDGIPNIHSRKKKRSSLSLLFDRLDDTPFLNSRSHQFNCISVSASATRTTNANCSLPP
ncbi:hypothetical protein CDEST_14007 [Colletotrichum destructivum]|uniref:Uncharacterized protein n=1 Tax=Colletotrichum destructivum TaxID=34406 RepID=A0AAX4J0C0_9PEZI|nr:hypothetical protein CDEST_14007 [Colletotrichum destructivum]